MTVANKLGHSWVTVYALAGVLLVGLLIAISFRAIGILMPPTDTPVQSVVTDTEAPPDHDGGWAGDRLDIDTESHRVETVYDPFESSDEPIPVVLTIPDELEHHYEQMSMLRDEALEEHYVPEEERSSLVLTEKELLELEQSGDLIY